MVTQAVILAGGKGTRLGEIARATPKALVDVAGKPLIEHSLEVLKRYGVETVVFLSGHLANELEAGLGDGSRYGLQITYQREHTPLGTAGAIKAAADRLEDDFYVVYGDIIFDMDLARLAAIHGRNDALGTLVIHPNDHPYDSDVVEIDDADRITALHRKSRDPEALVPNLVNAGIYLLNRRILDFIAPDTFADFGLDIFPAVVAGGGTLIGYNTPEYAKDVGTPERREAVAADIRSGKVARRNLSQKQRAVFLDRDGVLIRESGDAVTQDKVELLPGVADALRALNRSDYLAIVVTNQPGIAKGFVTESDVARTHMRIDTELGTSRVYVHDWKVCPHHPERGFEGERPELKVECDCRKPAPGMLLRAAEALNIDLAASWIIGDRTVDIEAGRRAGVGTVGVRTGFGCKDGKYPEAAPDHMAADLAEAVSIVLGQQEASTTPV